MKEIEHRHEYRFRAYAKVNLALFVLGQRKDGYHDISTVMTAIDLHDDITIVERLSGLTVNCPSMPELPQEQNLAYRAAFSFFAFSGKVSSCDISIAKRIPPGSGMGGGSSNAASVLLALNKVFGDDSIKWEDLLALASTTGSDVPFFLGFNGDKTLWEAALCTGRGEKVKPLPVRPSFHLVLVIPSFQIRTKKAYTLWDTMRRSKGLVKEEAQEKTYVLENLLEALSLGDSQRIALHLANDLDGPASFLHPEIPIIKEGLLSAGALGASMTGSGSSVFGICQDLSHAQDVKERFSRIVSKNKIGKRIVDIIVTRAGVSKNG